MGCSVWCPIYYHHWERLTVWVHTFQNADRVTWKQTHQNYFLPLCCKWACWTVPSTALNPYSEHKQTHIAGWKTYRSCFWAFVPRWKPTWLQRCRVRFWINTSTSWAICCSDEHFGHRFGPKQLCRQTAKDNDWVASHTQQSSAEFHTSAQRSFALYPCFCPWLHCQGFFATSLPGPIPSHYQEGQVLHPWFLMGSLKRSV